jgi:DNA replication licensing factor MCM3
LESESARYFLMTSFDLDQFNVNKLTFREYLSTPGSQAAPQFKDLVQGKRSRLILDLMALEKFKPGLSDSIITTPTQFLPVFDDALAEAILNEDAEYGKKSAAFPRIGFNGLVGSHNVTPRGLTAHVAGHLVCVEGIVSRCSASKPRAKVTCHYVAETGEVRVKEHRDATAIVTDVNAGGGAPTKDEEGRFYQTAHGLSLYRDYQKFTLQEMPENAPTGQMPKSVDVLVTDDLVDLAKPGDRVAVVGVYRPLANSQSGVTSGVFRFVLVANHVFQLNQKAKNPDITQKDLKNIKQIAARKDAYQLLGRSFAPSISGRDWEKKGLLLQQLGGAEKNLANGAHLRGDVNVLLIGDPSCGKSQLLRFVMNISPLAISTTGRGSTGVGLTAAITLDKETNEKMLEAGAMVLADRGVVCIDEFDKMSTNDRVAIHEVMEQQTVTIAKAGIHTSLNARCSVLAAANPVYGNFDPSISLDKNINLPDSILSRFDLVFIVRDLMSKEEDRKISSQVLRQLRYRHVAAPTSTSAVQKDQFGVASSYLEPRKEIFEAGIKNKKEGTTEVFDKHLMAMAAAEAATNGKKNSGTEFVSVEFLRKYISHAKSLPAPRLSEQAIDAISEVYTLMRQQSSNGDARFSVAVTPRTLEALIRLSTAHAKLYLRDTVEPADVSAVHEILQAARGSLTSEGGLLLEDDEAEEVSPLEEELMDIQDENTAPSNRTVSGVSSRKRREADIPTQRREDEDEEMAEPTPRKKPRTAASSSKDSQQSISSAAIPSSTTSTIVIADERYSEFIEQAGEVLALSSEGRVLISDLFREINKKAATAGVKRFTEVEAKACLDKLAASGKVFISGDEVYNMS